MPTTQYCRDSHINVIQNRFGELGHKLFKSYSYGIDNKHCLTEDAKLIAAYLRRLLCYKVFSDTVTYAYRFDFTKTDTVSATITITIGAQTIQITTAGDAADVINAFKSEVNDNTQAPINYEAETDSVNSVYIWTTDTNANSNDATSVAISGSNATSTATNVIDDLDEILDIWNCLTQTQICNILTHCHKILPEECNKSS